MTFEAGGRRVWLDLAFVTPFTASRRERARRAKVPGAAARAEEANKWSRYRGLATPFVLETGGRPGDSARSFIGKYAVDKGDGVSADAAAAYDASLVSLDAYLSSVGL